MKIRHNFILLSLFGYILVYTELLLAKICWHILYFLNRGAFMTLLICHKLSFCQYDEIDVGKTLTSSFHFQQEACFIETNMT